MAAREAAYPVPTVAGGKVEVVTLSGAATLRVNERLVVLPVVSATWKEIVAVSYTHLTLPTIYSV